MFLASCIVIVLAPDVISRFTTNSIESFSREMKSTPPCE